MGVGAGLYMCDVVVKSSRSLSHLLMNSCLLYNRLVFSTILCYKLIRRTLLMHNAVIYG